MAGTKSAAGAKRERSGLKLNSAQSQGLVQWHQAQV